MTKTREELEKMTIIGIVADWLKTHSFDGLWSETDCGCLVDPDEGGLCPCEYPFMTECHPGYKIDVPDGHRMTEICGPKQRRKRYARKRSR